MTRYNKGACYERELIELLRVKGFSAVRAAGSGMARFEQPDIIASNGAKILAFECKFSSSGYKTIAKEEVNEFYTFCKNFGCTAYLAFRFPHKEWGFIRIDSLTNNNISVKQEEEFLSINDVITR